MKFTTQASNLAYYMETSKEHLSILIGEKLSSVIFILDYLQLDFDGHRLTCYAFPKIIKEKTITCINSDNYRNLICSFLGAIVISTTDKDDSGINIGFETGDIFLSYTNEDVGEVAYFVDNDGKWSTYNSIS